MNLREWQESFSTRSNNRLFREGRKLVEKKSNDLIASVIDFLYLCIRNKKIPQTALQGLFWGKRKIIVMAKVQQISEITPSFAFTEFDFYKDYEESFKKSELGRIHSLLPLHEMAIRFGLIDPYPRKKEA